MKNNLIKSLFCFALVAFVVYQANSQNYRFLNLGEVYYFGRNNNGLAMQIEDFEISGSDTVYLPMKTIQVSSYWSDLYFANASWFGNGIIYRDNGQCLILNRDNDTIYLNVFAGINDEWVAYQALNLKVVAKISSYYYGSYLNFTDSIKRISFSCFDQNNLPVENVINNFTISVSKNYGLLTTLNFYDFPQIEESNRRLFSASLVGLKSINYGVRDLHWFDVFNYSMGDIIGVEEYSLTSDSLVFNSKRIIYYDEIISKQEFDDSIVYLTKRDVKRTCLVGDLNTPYYFEDTIYSIVFNQTIKKNFGLEYPAGKPVLINDTLYSYSLNYNNNSTRSKVEPRYYHRLVYDAENDMWHKIECDSFEDCNPVDQSYYYGLGGPYYEYSGLEVPSYGKNYRKLRYYKKGGIESGIPCDFANSITNLNKENITIYPNPVQNWITVKTDKYNSVMTLKIFSLFGSMVIEEKLTGNVTNIDASHLFKGLYIYQLINNNEIICTGKFVKL